MRRDTHRPDDESWAEASNRQYIRSVGRYPRSDLHRTDSYSSYAGDKLEYTVSGLSVTLSNNVWPAARARVSGGRGAGAGSADKLRRVRAATPANAASVQAKYIPKF
jgi:hypothetical protein